MGYYVESWTDVFLKTVGACITLTLVVMSFLNLRLKLQKMKDLKELGMRIKTVDSVSIPSPAARPVPKQQAGPSTGQE